MTFGWSRPVGVALLTLALTVAGACTTDAPLTELIVVVDSDLAAPTELDEVRIDVVGLGEAPQRATATLAGPGDLPVTADLVHRGGPLGPITVTAAGLVGGMTRVERRASVSFVRDRTMVLRLDLVGACVGVACASEQTCAAGSCRSTAVPVGELEEWTGTAGRLDASTPVDTGLRDTGPGDTGPGDAGPGDAGPMDAGPADAGPPDAGPPDAGPTRVVTGLVVLYELDEGSGTTVMDTSGVGAPMDLTVADPAAVTWGAGHITLDASTIIRTPGPATKIIDACTATNEITVEAWVEAANTTQSGPSRMVSCSLDTSVRNFTLGQVASGVGMRLRTTTGTDNGGPEIITAAGTFSTALTHLVYTRDVAGAGRMYADGVEIDNLDRDGDFSSWDATHPFALGNEITLDRTWLGTFHLVAVYDRALPPADIATNFMLGPDG